MATWALCLFFFLLKGSFLSHPLLRLCDVDLVAIFMAHVLAYLGEKKAAVFGFGQGLLIDIFSAGLLGTFALLYLLVFFWIKIGSRFFDLRSASGLMIIIFFSVVLREFLFAAILEVFSMEFLLTYAVFPGIGASAICSSLMAPLFFLILNFMSHWFLGDAKEPA
jgi:rod shape-determining protein MreD